MDDNSYKLGTIKPESEIDLTYIMAKPETKTSKKRELIYVKDKEGIERRQIIEFETPYRERMSLDLSTANLTDAEMTIVRDAGVLCEFFEYLSERSGYDLTQVIDLNENIKGLFLISSKSKDGFLARLMKTSITREDSRREEITKALEEKKKGWFGR